MNSRILTYDLNQKLGEGGMATVWYAENLIGKRFAIKLLNPGMIDKESIAERFRNEAKLMVDLNHPHIRQVIDYYEDNATMAIIMEYLDGKDLGRYLIDHGPISEAQAVLWFNDILDAMTYVHQKRYIHRDIKPSNIFLTQEGTIKVMDFGIAKIINSSQELTQTQTAIGSPQYMSPEQITTPKSIDFRSDIYSLGVTLYALLTGKKPYNDSYGSSYMIQAEIVKAPLPIIQGVSTAINAVIQKATSKAPNDRYQSCQEFKVALNKVTAIEDEPIVVVMSDALPPKPPILTPLITQIPPKSNTSRYVAIGVGIFIALFAGLYWFGTEHIKSEIKEGVAMYDSRNYTKAFNLLYENRDSQYMLPEAMHDLGYMYVTGNGTQQDFTEAMTWFRKAANKGYFLSNNDIGIMYRDGEGVTKDYSAAKSFFEKGAAEGDDRAKYSLGNIYALGLGVSVDTREAFKWFMEAAEADYATAQNEVGLAYFYGRGVDYSSSEAVKWFRKSAEQGYAKGQTSLGYMYEKGYVNNLYDYDTAKSWYAKAAEQNDPTALYNLGVLYENGSGTSRDWPAAVTYYKKAAVLGDKSAQKHLTENNISWQ